MLWYSVNLFIIFIIIISFYLIFRRLDKRWSKLNDYLASITNTINSVRYGNLSAKIENAEYPKYQNLSESINRMVETLNDREKMIVEYQTELTRQNKFLEAVINSLSDGILIVDENYNILRITPKIAKWFVDEGADLINRNIFDFIQPQKDLKLEEFNKNEVFIKNNSSFRFEATTLNLNIDENKQRYIVVIKDVTDQKELETLREDFVATLTHDLKVPIVAEANILEFLISGKFGEMTDKQHEAIANMKACNQELLELVQVLLETYKIKETGIELYKHEFDLVPFIKEIVDDMAPIAEKSGFKINFESLENLRIYADDVQLKRVVRNLISNAISHSESNKNIDLKLAKEDNIATISVIDYGKGIPAEDIDKIFNKYYSTANKFRKIGTGLGLYLSQQIIKSHGGEITVKSDENECTEFCIKLYP